MTDKNQTRIREILLGAMATMAILVTAAPAYGAVRCVPDTSPGGCDTTHATIQAAIDASSAGDTVRTAPGTFVENIVLDLDLTLEGAQAGTGACGRVTDSPSPASESIIAPGAGIGINLQTGSAGSTITGFSFVGPDRGIESSSGPIDGVAILRNHFQGHTTAVFLNDSGTDITVDQNSLVGSTGTQFHLDQDNFDGFHFTNNCVLDGGGTGLFVDGNHNVGASAGRAPRIEGNLFEGNVTGANLGRFAFENGDIVGNVFRDNSYPGLQGGIQGSEITGNVFDGNGRGGIEFTGFGGSGDATRGAQNNQISCNNFLGNGFINNGWGIFLSSGQSPGTISTNVFFNNNLFGNRIGLTYSGTEVIDAENNYWGHATGPTNASNPAGVGDEVEGDTVDFDPWLASVAGCAPTEGLPASFTVNKTYDDATTDAVTVNLSCASGTVTTNDLSASPGNPAVFEVTGFDGDPNCTATESGVPAGYVADNTDCADVALLADGECTINNSPIVRATFRVTKDFTDDNPMGVEVQISCNTGLLLDQSKVITEDKYVEFVVTEYDTGELNCNVFEMVPNGYSSTYEAGFDEFANAVISHDAEGCHFADVINGEFTCHIENSPDPVEVEIIKDWVFEGSSAMQSIDTRYDLTLFCDTEIVDGSPFGNGQETPQGDLPGCGLIFMQEAPQGGIFADWCKVFNGEGPDTFLAEVIPEWPDSHCYVIERALDDAVEVDNGCLGFTVSAGNGASCKITNTVFFEGIPTLNQYGMALMALLMLGLGFVGFRRFV